MIELPFEILMAVFAFTMSLSVIGIWQKIPLLMFIGGALLTLLFILTDNIVALGDTQTCTSSINTTTCEHEPYALDIWVKIFFMLLGSMWMITGALVWKATEE